MSTWLERGQGIVAFYRHLTRRGPCGCQKQWSPVESLPSGWGLGLLYDHLFGLHILQKGALQPEETCLMWCQWTWPFYVDYDDWWTWEMHHFQLLSLHYIVTSMSHRFLGALFRNRLYTCDPRPSPTFAPPFCRDASWMGIFLALVGSMLMTKLEHLLQICGFLLVECPFFRCHRWILVLAILIVEVVHCTFFSQYCTILRPILPCTTSSWFVTPIY